MYKKLDIIAFLSLILTMAVYKYYYQPFRDKVLWHQVKLNNTIRSNQSYLIFNRVPKAGSQTVQGLIRVLSKINGFNLYNGQDSWDYKHSSEKYFLSEKDKRIHIDMWTGLNDCTDNGVHDGARSCNDTIKGNSYVCDHI